MKQSFYLIILIFLFISCKEQEKTTAVTPLNLELSKEIDNMAKRDQQMQLNMLKFSNDEIQFDNVEQIREEVYKKHADQLDKILNEYGYPSYDIVGKKSTDHFYTLLLHARNYPEVQKKALELMKTKVNEEQVELYQYVDLADQYAVQNDLPQPYGTIVNFDENGKAFIDNPSKEIEENRANFELDSLNSYLRKMTIQYFNNNQQLLAERGITEPEVN